MRSAQGTGRSALIAGVLMAIVLSACGGSATTPAGSIARQEAVVRGWTNALRRGDVNAASAYFALPSVFANGATSAGEIQAVALRTVAQVRAANETLSCGAKYVSAVRFGRYLNVLFVLSGRPGPGGSNCAGGVGQTARTDFLIKHGKIVAWIRAPDVSPGPSTTPSAPVPAATVPTPSVAD